MRMTRRSFLGRGARAGALLGTATAAFGQSGGGEACDVLIRGGMVYDGSGGPGREADIAVVGDKIYAIGGKLREGKAREIIDARGLAVAPGFIDPHAHTDRELLINPKAESMVHQGVTSQVAGNCGSSPCLTSAAHAGKDLSDFFSRLEGTGIGFNYATLVGHGAIRTYVMGTNDRPPTDRETQRMRQVLRDSLGAGARGMSTGLYYAPGSFAKTEEIIALCRELVPFGGVYATHMRDEGDTLLESIDEALTIGRQSGASVQISHLKTMYPRNHAKLPAALSRIEAARKEGINVLADRYPYIASSTTLDVFFPRWAQQGATREFLARLQDRSLEPKLREHLKQIEEKIVSWNTILICSVGSEKNRGLEGKTVQQAAAEAQKPPFEFIRDLLVEENNRVDIINFAMSEDNLRKILAHPLVAVCSDGFALAPYGKLGGGKPHPRSFGTFPRVLGKYVREEKVLTLPQAVRKMTSLAADKFGLKGRGYLREGYFADLALFNPDTVADRADWLQPHRYPSGIEYVLVNGRVVINHGEHTGALPGKCLQLKKERF
jgi:N-acyl-D-amino-acid deacylase